ncbi:hypothetical protein EDD15DRAFT_2465522 [Pisolithus albus]|nr:hypothetical protein EDD15DRAFT_2465522 [Pisolithus albus]
MADSIPSSWICDYLIEIAERHGGQLGDVPLCNKKKRVQLTEFLTFHENSYVWAWISDKAHRIAVRISREGVENFKAQHAGREVFDCRFAVMFIQNFRPILARRPVGANQKGNTPISHIALEIQHVKHVGPGGHVFCDPKDVESNPSVKENVLKLRKQEQQVSANVASLTFTTIFASFTQATGFSGGPGQSISEENTQNGGAQYEVDRWKFAFKPTQQEAVANLEAGPTIVTTGPARVLASPTPLIPLPESPRALVPQGTPSVWSPSHCSSPMQEAELRTSPSRNMDTDACDTELHSDLEVEKPTEETIESVRSLRSCSPRPPTPLQLRGRISPNIRSPSSPSLPNNHFPLPSFSTFSASLRKKVKRKVPPPEVFPMRDPNHSGSTQILVPNSDPSATISQPHSQVSQSHTMSQAYSQSQSHAPPFSSSLSNEFKPGETSTPRTVGELSHSKPSKLASRMTSELISSQSEAGNEKARENADESNTSRAQAFVVEGNQVHEINDQLPSLVSSPFPPTKSERLETEQEPCERKLDARPPINGSPAAGGEEQHDSAHNSGELSEDDMEIHAVLCQDSFSTSRSVETTAANNNGNVSAGSLSPRSMHSLFSVASSVPERIGRSSTPEFIDTTADLQPSSDFVVPFHDPEIWKNPSFLRSRKEGETSTGRSQRKHRLSGQLMPPQKRMKMDESSSPEVSPSLRPAVVMVRPQSPLQSEKTTEEGRDPGEKREQRSIRKSTDGDRSNRASSQDPTTQSLGPQHEGSTNLPRLDGLAVDFMSMFHDPALSHFRTAWRELQGILLRTGRIRTLGEEILGDGSVYLSKD